MSTHVQFLSCLLFCFFSPYFLKSSSPLASANLPSPPVFPSADCRSCPERLHLFPVTYVCVDVCLFPVYLFLVSCSKPCSCPRPHRCPARFWSSLIRSLFLCLDHKSDFLLVLSCRFDPRLSEFPFMILRPGFPLLTAFFFARLH